MRRNATGERLQGGGRRRRAGLSLSLDIFEPKDFSHPGAQGCNHCGGVISETLIPLLATEGIVLPDPVVMTGIETYVLHSDGASVSIETPLEEKRIAAVFRGSGPKGATLPDGASFDGFLLEMARQKGANVVRAKVDHIRRADDAKCVLHARDEEYGPYDLLVGATGLDAASLKLFSGLGFGYAPPATFKAAIRELHLGEPMVRQCLGEAMHVFLQNIPGLKFAAIIPKRDYATACLLGDVNKDLMDRFLTSPEVRELFPSGFDLGRCACACLPELNMGLACAPYADRVALVGDCGVTRLFKDGIGAAYRVAKSLSTTVVTRGVSARDLGKYFYPACARLRRDNALGKLCFMAVDVIKAFPSLRHAMIVMAAAEQQWPGPKRRMSTVLWDTFTGSAPYAEIFRRAVHPAFLARLGKEALLAAVTKERA